jgi:hypothetical protein
MRAWRPTYQQEVLLRAALGERADALTAWEQWTDNVLLAEASTLAGALEARGICTMVLKGLHWVCFLTGTSQIGRAARAAARTRFPMDRCVKRYVAVYARVLEDVTSARR